jgi:hypothetical protein
MLTGRDAYVELCAALALVFRIKCLTRQQNKIIEVFGTCAPDLDLSMTSSRLYCKVDETSDID